MSESSAFSPLDNLIKLFFLGGGTKLFFFFSPRYSPQPIFKAAVGFTITGSEDGGGREGRPADAAQPGGRCSGLLHPERPLSAEGSNCRGLHNHIENRKNETKLMLLVFK